MTDKQKLVAHLEAEHGEHVHKGTHNNLTIRHRSDHEARKLPHTHRPEGWATGASQVDLRIYLSPPRNSGGTPNWVLSIDHGKGGQRYELRGTWIGEPDKAKSVANGILGYAADWVENGWGYKVKEKADV